jgi:activator of 2-hydroxyglutaryl-CoA dehydratase/predicted nucleotide-binding protein (sugar kinase/HSP70/actin superfamily)
MDRLLIGIDVGSTTAKAAVVNPQTKTILWHEYRRHHAKQAELVHLYLSKIRTAFARRTSQQIDVLMTGSGAKPIAEQINAKVVQEVNAVAVAVEHLYPNAGSVVELGGQDAKIIIFRSDPATGDRQTITTMNDKCAAGTGATIDKCLSKVGLSPEKVATLRFQGSNLHHISAKCGVFAETDVVNLVKSGVPASDILFSLADAIVLQNLSVLARGNTLPHTVLLLGGPNCYLPVLQDCWRLRIPETWRSRNHHYPQNIPLDELIFVPPNAVLFAAYGAALYGLRGNMRRDAYPGEDALAAFIRHSHRDRSSELAAPPLAENDEELSRFKATYSVPVFFPPPVPCGETIEVYLGLDGGSTSSKAVLTDSDGRILLKDYQLSKGNPLQDMKQILGRLTETISAQGANLRILGFGVTGYAAEVIASAVRADVNIVETVAHMNSALHFFNSVDVICDIGGQDIKVLMLKGGELKHFRLSSQCSAGNGMLLQAMADQFGVPLSDFAEHAFRARVSAQFGYGCAVFLDSDRVTLQREGFSKQELMAGLAMVLPKNIWQYVVQVPRLSALGRRFVLQGGTQYNLAAVKAQVDYIRERVPDAEIMVHPHPGEAGAIGAALEAMHTVKRRGYSTFVGHAEAMNLRYTTRNDAATRCRFCPNGCARTFIDTRTPRGTTSRYIAGFCCDNGTVEDKDTLKTLRQELKQRASQVPNLVSYEAKLCFSRFYRPAPLPEAGYPVARLRNRQAPLSLFGAARSYFYRFRRSSHAAQARRKQICIAMPRVLNMWNTAPFWRTYFETLGIPNSGIIFSDESSEALFRRGGRYGSTDPCFPSKIAQAHIHNILFEKHSERHPVHILYFPTVTHTPSFVERSIDSACCPVVAGTPNVIKAAFTKEVDFFAQRNIRYIDDAVTMNEPELLKQQLYQTWGDALDITGDENRFALNEAWRALHLFDERVQAKGRQVLDRLEADGKLGILLLARPYHHDPGVGHEIAEEFQAHGYPILSIRSIPKDKAWLHRFFARDMQQGRIDSPLEIGDVWPENYSANSAQKVWAAKFAARHPNIATLDLSSFKCGLDAPTYGLIENILGTAGAPHCAFHDLDATRPYASIKLRVRTYIHSLQRRESALRGLRGGTATNSQEEIGL